MQFSKKLAVVVTLFWMVYRIAQFVVILIEPTVANSMVDMVRGVDSAMMANMAWYTGNSSVEKLAIAFVNSKEKETKNDADEESGADEEEEETDSNG